MLVGNDVVDLADPEISGHHHRERFVARVCAPEERLLLGTDPKRVLWTLFAAKEAAYKVLVKLGLEPGFAHRAITVSPDFSSVRWQEHTLRLTVDANEQRVHAVACTGEAKIVCGARPGVDARSFLCESAAAILGCDPADLSVARDPKEGAWDGFDPPRLLLRSAPVAMDVSLSQDGAFVAFAAVGQGRPFTVT